MVHKLLDVNELPRTKSKRSRELQDAIIKIADVVSPGKAMLIDCEKLGKKPNTVLMAAKKLIASGELPGIKAIARNRGEDVYLVRA